MAEYVSTYEPEQVNRPSAGAVILSAARMLLKVGLRLAYVLGLITGASCVWGGPCPVPRPWDTEPRQSDRAKEMTQTAAAKGLQLAALLKGVAISASAAAEIERTCEEVLPASLKGNPAGWCSGLDMPLFVTANDTYEASKHDYDAITGWNVVRKQPALLTWGRFAGNIPSQWYNSASWLNPPCKGSAAQHCDEYPFGTTQEGGPLNHADVRLVDGKQNSLQGARLILGIYPRPAGCSVRPGTKFLVVPVPNLDVPTGWLSLAG